MWRKLREAEWQFSPSGVYRVWPLSACDSRPNRYAVRWFKAIITSTLVDGWWCLSCGCWSLMNETLVNTTKNVIRGPPPADSRQSREKKRWVCKCVFSTITTYRHTRRDHLPLRHFILTGLSNSFYSCSALLNKRWKNGEKISGGKYVSLWMCVCVFLRVWFLSSGSDATRPNDMCTARCAACRYARSIQSGFIYRQWEKESSTDAGWKGGKRKWLSEIDICSHCNSKQQVEI